MISRFLRSRIPERLSWVDLSRSSHVVAVGTLAKLWSSEGLRSAGDLPRWLIQMAFGRWPKFLSGSQLEASTTHHVDVSVGCLCVPTIWHNFLPLLFSESGGMYSPFMT